MPKVKKLFIIIGVALIGLLNAVPVMAATTAVVSVLGVPQFGAGIFTFNVIYTSDTRMDLNWTVSASTANVMVRAKYGQYPVNPPDINTAPSDGYLVYYGSGLSAVDTSMDMNQNAGTLYYTAWAQNIDGTWNLVPSKSAKESREVVLVALIMLGAIGSIFAIYKRQLLFAVGASVVWFLLIAYTRTNPLPNIVAGSSTDSLWIGVCVAFSVGTMVSTFILRNNDEVAKQEQYRKSSDYRSPQDINRYNSKGSGYESTESYQARLQALSKRNRK